jgi:hypothetical protein
MNCATDNPISAISSYKFIETRSCIAHRKLARDIIMSRGANG